jgi:hypothetical protein
MHVSRAWMQQKGKSDEQCQMEYVALLAVLDKEYAGILAEVASGKIKNIKATDTATSAGGALAKSVPRPKPVDSSEYLKSLNEE